MLATEPQVPAQTTIQPCAFEEANQALQDCKINKLTRMSVGVI